MRLRAHQTRLVHGAALLFVVNAAGAGTLHAADYASGSYGATNIPDASARSAAPAKPPVTRTPITPSIDAGPHRGETMAVVRARYGAPRSTRGPVGQPPITRWNYDRYHVYFEGDRVVHTVVPADPEPLYHVDDLDRTRP
ncbi:hypothetical protein [Salinisphaera sp.]|uniref:hypothetical protein n=1 Tax=Salinisphaera sp. TaxID=1914330 RepID=UPI002D77BDF7|nr:hypothetical protein [Salinisphaera sp.]